jgi:hypothetical protein
MADGAGGGTLAVREAPRRSVQTCTCETTDNSLPHIHTRTAL